MLAGTIAYVALIALVAATVLSAGLAMTRMTIARMTRPYLVAGYQRAAASLEQSIGAKMQNGGVPFPAPTFTPIPPACANASCSYMTSETVALTGSPPATPGPSCDASQTNCAFNVQINRYVSESRLTAAITVNVLDAKGYVVATRSGTLVLRTMETPPYVAVAGSRDGTFDDIVTAAAAGDDGGVPPATPNPCMGTMAGAITDTAVRVEYRNRQTPSFCTDGGAWADSSYSAHAGSTGWSP
jgi:hypothetical protein